MKNFEVIVPGHRYMLRSFEHGPRRDTQTLQFIHKELTVIKHKNPRTNQVEKKTKELVTIDNGTTNEAVIEMLIDRLEFLYDKLPSDETKTAIEGLKTALSALESRTAKRKKAGVEGTHKDIPKKTAKKTAKKK